VSRPERDCLWGNLRPPDLGFISADKGAFGMRSLFALSVICLVAGMTAVLGSAVAAAVEDTSAAARYAPLGFSKEKPASGPAVEVAGGYLVPYRMQIPGSEVEFEMIPIPGGVATVGSPAAADGSQADETPQIQVKIEPMWVAKHETTWAEYKLFMSMYRLFKSFEQQGLRKIDAANAARAITTPTELYEPTFTYEYGEALDMPAVTVTQYSAKQYTKWLSGLSGHQYRLPSEAEWEYACRAGTTTAYSFGDDPAELDAYAWYADNAGESLHPVGSKQPNPWGLHDMHGSVMEWTIDGYTADGYQALAGKPGPLSMVEAIQWPTSLDKRVVRGGGWQDSPAALRSAARVSSADMAWKETDPNIPKSPWWYTDDPARTVGFRIVRSYQPLDEPTIQKFYEIDDEDIQLSVDIRLEEGRGVRGLVDPELAEEIRKFLDR
jgi:formylglycine-generating enzyme